MRQSRKTKPVPTFNKKRKMNPEIFQNSTQCCIYNGNKYTKLVFFSDINKQMLKSLIKYGIGNYNIYKFSMHDICIYRQ